MTARTFEDRRALEAMEDGARQAYQLERLNNALREIWPHNRFYRQKLGHIELPLRSLEQVRDWPLTTKAELVGTEPEGFAMNRTFPIERYVRLHRTSGTRGRPLVVLDTHDDWCWWLDGWQFVLDAAGISAGDRIVMAFSFGPFIGFWSAYDACVARGALVAPTGGMTTLARLDLLLSLGASCVFCTPSYALRLAEVASENGIPLATSPVRCLVVAGEPGGSVPATRRRIEAAWGARVVDHSGATEVGPWGYADRERLGLHVNESEFLAECLCVGSDQPAADGQLAELVLTTLGRSGSPVLRYRTGDLVRPTRPAAGPNRFLLLSGGVLGRVDEMLIIRGVNVFPSAVEAILREFPEIGEFRITAYRRRELEELRIEIEDLANDPGRVVRALDIRLGLRVEVSCVAPGSLPRFEGKGRRFVDRRDAAVAAADGT